MLVGERDSTKIDGFDYGNSPAVLADIDLDNRRLVLTTTNGVRAALHAVENGTATGAETFVTGFGNADTTATWLMRNAYQSINLLASNPTGDDDLACAEYIKARLLNSDAVSADEVSSRVRASESAQKFLDADQPEFRPRDLDICARPASSSIVMVVDKSHDPIRLVPLST